MERLIERCFGFYHSWGKFKGKFDKENLWLSYEPSAKFKGKFDKEKPLSDFLGTFL